MRADGRELSPSKGVQKCGRVALYNDTPRIQLTGRGRAYYAGVFRCGSVWECPVCAQGIAMQRAEELKGLLAEHRKRGGGDVLLTLTMPHDQGNRLRPMQQAIANGWRSVIGGKVGQELRRRFGLAYIRGHDLTVGVSGWHPHLHVILLTARPLVDCPNCRHTQDCRDDGSCGHHAGQGCTSGCEVGELAAAVYARWCRSLERANYRTPSPQHGLDVRRCRIAKYITKLGLGDELAKTAFKRGHTGQRTPFQVLADITFALHVAVHKDDQRCNADMNLWVEYAKGMKGAKQLTYSKGLRKRYALPEPAPDDQYYLDQFEPQKGVIVTSFEPAEWRDVIAPNTSLQLRLLHLAEEHPPDEAADRIRKLLDQVQGREVAPF
jgi:hypothetical protein